MGPASLGRDWPAGRGCTPAALDALLGVKRNLGLRRRKVTGTLLGTVRFSMGHLPASQEETSGLSTSLPQQDDPEKGRRAGGGIWALACQSKSCFMATASTSHSSLLPLSSEPGVSPEGKADCALLSGLKTWSPLGNSS